jgi:hypothetical protein
MKKSKRGGKARPARGRTRAFRAALFASALLVAGAATAVARYGSHADGPARAATPATSQPDARPGNGLVTVEVGGRKLQLNAQTLQQGPLAQEQAKQIADALKDNKSAEGLVEVKHEDGTVSVDLQGRFQNVMLAKRNDDGSVSAECVDTPEAAQQFLLKSAPTTTVTGSGASRKGAARE